MRALILFVLFGFSLPAGAQTSVGPLLDRLTSVDPETTTPADCEAQVARAESLNGPDLLYGAAVCFAAERPIEGSFLLNVGQTRSILDLSLMVPASRTDSDIQTALYGVLYFHAGGPGAEEVLRDAASRERFFAMFDSWSPAYSVEYHPGWNVRRRPDSGEYQSAVAEVQAGRRRQLNEIVTLYSDEAYYALHRRFQDLQRRNPNGFVEGTPDANLSRELMRQMDERAAALGLRGDPDDRGPEDVANLRFPPVSPAPDEIAVPAADAVAERCAAIAERITIAGDSRVMSVLVTRSPEWGTIWRADIGGGDQPPARFTCTETTTSSRPMQMGEESITSLPESPPSPAPQE